MTVRDPATLTCREVVELVSDFLGDELAPEDRITIEQHLLVCPPCTAFVGQIRETVALTRRLAAREEPSTASALEVFRRWQKKKDGGV